jgi:hypothetical protein
MILYVYVKYAHVAVIVAHHPATLHLQANQHTITIINHVKEYFNKYLDHGLVIIIKDIIVHKC